MTNVTRALLIGGTVLLLAQEPQDFTNAARRARPVSLRRRLLISNDHEAGRCSAMDPFRLYRIKLLNCHPDIFTLLLT
jgi:hypothetical protein